jgi:flagellar hook protein FlgE
VASIINGLFSGRTGIASHGVAIAVVGDNISNASTVGYKAARSEFEDIVAGGQASGVVVGSGSQISSVNAIFQQGTLEFSGRALDLAIDGNGFFVVEQDAQRFFTRAGNFRIDEGGFIINQKGLKVLGFPAGGSGTLEPINVNGVSQDSVSTGNSAITGNLNAAADTTDTAWVAAPLNGGASTGVDFSDINEIAEYSTVVDVFDSLGAKHSVTIFFNKTAANTWQARAYAPSEDLTTAPVVSGEPRQLTIAGGTAAQGTFALSFDTNGQLVPGTSTASLDLVVPWNNGSGSQTMTFDLSNFTQYSSASNITAITQDGKGIGTVGNVNISKDGSIFALLSNGQAAVIGTIGMANFSNPEGLVRQGGNLLQQSPDSGEPVIGKPKSGTFGAVSSGSLELSTVDIANEFVKLITLQRGFQANSRIINTINSLLNEIVQLA